MKTYALRLTPAQARLLRQAIGEAYEACTNEIALGGDESWEDSRNDYERLEKELWHKLGAIAEKDLPPAPIETIQRRDV